MLNSSAEPCYSKLSVAIPESGPTMMGTIVSGTFSYRSTAWMPESIFMSGAPILPTI